MSLKRALVYILFIVVFCQTKGYAQIPITFNVGSGSGTQGSTVCIDITVEDFIKVTSTQFVIRFDPTVISLDTPLVLTNSALNANGMGLLSLANFNDDEVGDGFMNYIWFDLNTTGITLNDGDVLFTLCFTLIGDPCDQSFIDITESGPVPFEFIQIDCITGEENDFKPIINKGEITIDPDGYTISSAFCSSDDASNSGSITFAGSGGTGPYDWSVTPGGASGSGLNDCEMVTVDDLAPGNYTVTLIDANNTVRVEIITITTNSDFPFVLTLDGTNPTCFNRTNGSVSIANIEGGESPFTYEWSTLQFFDEINQLGTGDYALTVTDVNGCTTSSEVSLDVDTLTVSFQVISDPSCNGASDGVVSITAEGGTPFPTNDYMFEVDGINGTFYFANSFIPTNPFTPANLPSGCFEVQASDNATIACYSDPIEFCIEAGSFSTLVIDVTDISCNGECDGSVVITANDMGNYSFMVRDQDGNSVLGMNTNLAFDTDNLCEGVYDITVNDVNGGCTIDTSFTISEPDLLELIVIDSLGPGCGGGDGFISFEANGGTADYTFLWNDGFDQPARTNMGGGNYSVTVTDMNGCQDSISFVFADGGDIGLNGIVCNAVSCGGAMDGSLCASVTSMGTFTFSWEDSNGMSIGTGPQIDGIGGGIYYVTATDGMCTATDTVIVAPGDTPSVNIVQVDPTCSDTNDGTLTATLATGTSPATFEWTEPPSTAILSANAVLSDGVGTYNLHVTDGNGCELDTLVEMTPPTNLIQVDISNIVENTCFGICEGSATFTASGGSVGSGAYVFFISGVGMVDPGGNMAVVNTICGGQNWVYAIDGVCASDTFWFDVPDAEPIVLVESTSTINPPSCAGGNDGNITIDVAGGNSSSYDILWVNENIAGPSLTGLMAGSYIYSVTDGSNCVFMDTIILESPDSLLVQINPFSTVDIGCFSGSMGRIGLLTTGGNSGQLTYTWSPAVSNTDFAENLSPGSYSVTVSDSKGCTAEISYELTSAPPIEAVINVPAEPDCFGGQTCIGVESASGGVGNNFTFTINNSPILLPLDTCINVFAGPYLLTVFDSIGCEFDTLINISQPEEIIVDLGPDITINLGENSDPVSAFIVSELNIDSILWNSIDDLECNTVDCQVVTFSPLATTDYTITVIDENGCLATDDITVFVDLARNVFFPNIFSPNGDNQNDFFQLATGSGVTQVNFFRMFDRWGNMVHEEMAYMPDDSLHPGWDGTYNNRNVESGVYVYFAEVLFEDNVRIVYKGDVTLVR